MTNPTRQQSWQRVLVYGFGASGSAATRFLADRGVEVVVVDRRSAADLMPGAVEEFASPPATADAGPVPEFILGGEPSRLPADLDAVVVSPGVPPGSPLLEQARRRGLPVLAEVELAFAYLSGPVIGITGSNGKSTTTAMTGALLRAAGMAAEVCGNIGVPLVSVVAGQEGRIFVVELSSFQLETVDEFRPKAAALLNLSPDHLDRHGTLQKYLAAKARIFARQKEDDFAVLNADDPMVRSVGTRARKRFFSRLQKVQDGCHLEGDSIVEVDPQGGSRELFRRSDVAQQGEHNLENAMAAALLARSIGAAPDAFATALSSFEGLAHRMQTVAILDGVRWVDDSKGTNVGAVLKSLESMPDGSTHLILGGRGKGESFEPLRELVEAKVDRVYLIGETSAELAEVLAGAARLEAVGDLAAAVRRAAAVAAEGDVVLLSPACTSFDQYANFAKRGDHFHSLVGALAERRVSEGSDGG